jgi:tyrosyl-tRNA synthetase
MSSQLLQDLEWRGLLAQTTERSALEKELNNGPVTFYVGFDPTAPSLHVGNLVIILAMRRFQLAGHNPIALVGGATGLVGDPSGRNEERSLNDEKIVADWVAQIREQLKSFLDFEGPNKAVMANNLDWTKPYSALQFLRDIGKHFSVNQMLAKDSVSARLEAGGISYTEFSYQVLQALDYLELYQSKKCLLQLGGSDQWGNIVAGLDLIRKVANGAAHALTIPLMAKADGSKFGKTSAGAIWLDPEMTSPYAFFQFWINSDDADIPRFLKTFSFKERGEIEKLIERHNENPGRREAHRELALELTALVHGETVARNVEAAASALFGQGSLEDLDSETLASALSQLPKVEISMSETFPTWIELISATGVVKSKSDARRVIKEGGAYLNNEKIPDEEFKPSKDNLIHGRFLILRKGKRDLAAVEVR